MKMAVRNFCSACGLTLDTGAAFCGKCGTRIPTETPQGVTNQLTSSWQSKASTSGATLPAYGGTLFGHAPVDSREMFSSFDDGTSDREWYERTWFVVLLLIGFWFIGVIVLWRSKFFTTGQKIVFSILTALFDAFLWGVLMAMLTPSNGFNYRSSIHGAPIFDSQSTSDPETRPSPTQPRRVEIDFSRPYEVSRAIEVVREGCLSRGNNYCGILCKEYQTAVIELNKALTSSYFIEPSTREPQYASTFESYYRGCSATANTE